MPVAEPPAQVEPARHDAPSRAAYEADAPANELMNTNFFLSYMDRSSKERAEQTASFERALAATREDFARSISALRNDFRFFGVIMLAGILALAGVNVAINSGALNFAPAPRLQPAETEPTP